MQLPATYDVALSLSSNAIDEARLIVQELERRGLRVFVYYSDNDEYQNPSIVEGTLAAFGRARSIVYVMNARFFSRPVCMTELLWGLYENENCGTRLLFVVLDQCDFLPWTIGRTVEVVDARSLPTPDIVERCLAFLNQ